MKKNQREEMQERKGKGRCRKEGGDAESKERGVAAESYFRFRVRKHSIYTCFFVLSVDLVESVWFGSIGFRLWKPKPN